jgi:hypothetical protein
MPRLDSRDSDTYPYSTNHHRGHSRTVSDLAITVHRDPNCEEFPWCVRIHSPHGIMPMCICEDRVLAEGIAEAIDAALRGSIPAWECAMKAIRKHARDNHGWNPFVLDKAGA